MESLVTTTLIIAVINDVEKRTDRSHYLTSAQVIRCMEHVWKQIAGSRYSEQPARIYEAVYVYVNEFIQSEDSKKS